MGLAPQLITEDIYQKALICLNAISNDNRLAIILRAIVSAKENGMNMVARVFETTANSVRNWVKSLWEKGSEGLDYLSCRGKKSKITEHHKN
jgi:transposase